MSAHDSLRELDYAVLQQCMHCGMCLPTCPTYDATRLERHSPRGRISLMRAIADGQMDASRAFGDEMYFCLGCLACETACPAGVDYAQLFETARAEAERSHQLDNPRRTLLRTVLLRGLFMRPRLLRTVGRALRFYQTSGFQTLFRVLRLNRLLPGNLRNLESQTPAACDEFSCDLIRPVERPSDKTRHRVGMLTGCVQDIVLPDVNRDTVDALLANGCEVRTPAVQNCCGSLHAHNGDLDAARVLARRQLDAFDLSGLDAIITNAAGCGSHLKTYGRLLADDPVYAARAAEWARKVRDISEWLVEIGWRRPRAVAAETPARRATYHDACHLCHGQKITRQPREILRGIPGLELVELPESTWCCGSAGVYNITQPEMAARLQARKLGHVFATGAEVAVTANPGCHLQLLDGARRAGRALTVVHPVTLLAGAYRAENALAAPGTAPL